MPEVSVVLPTYNRAHFLPRAVRSVVAQTFTEWELIVVDDGSTDDTRAVVRSLRATYSDSVRYLYQPHSGVSVARNRGVEASRGHLIAFLDSDDVFLPDKLMIQTRAMKDDGTRFSFTNAYCFDEAGAVIIERYRIPPDFVGQVYPKPLEIRCNCITTPTVMLAREAFCAAGGFDPEMTICEDIDLWTRIAMRERMTLIPHCLAGVQGRGSPSYPYVRHVEARYSLYRKAFDRDPGLPPAFLLQLLDEAFSIYAEEARARADCDIAQAFDESRGALAAGADPAITVARTSARVRTLERAQR